jgi:hypothetical protein
VSSNVVDYRQGTARRHTVAELLARERATVMAVGRADSGHARRESLPAVDLLRREGVDLADAPTQRFAPVAAEVTREEPVPVPPALRPEAGKQQKVKKLKPHGTTTMSRAVVLFGLTVAGLIALKPSIASSPVTEAPEDPNRALSAQQGARQNVPEYLRTGITTPTTLAASMMLNDTTDAASPMRGSDGSTPAHGGAAANDGPPQTATPTPTGEASARTTTPPQPERDVADRSGSSPDRSGGSGGSADEQTGDSSPGGSTPDDGSPDNSTPDDESDNGGSGGDGSGNGGSGADRDGDGLLDSLDPVLDPVTGAVSGVLDLGGGLLGR